jgi:hypothetical protein
MTMKKHYIGLEAPADKQQEVIDRIKELELENAILKDRIASFEVHHIPNRDWIAICSERRMYNSRIENMRARIAQLEAELKETIQ